MPVSFAIHIPNKASIERAAAANWGAIRICKDNMALGLNFLCSRLVFPDTPIIVHSRTSLTPLMGNRSYDHQTLLNSCGNQHSNPKCRIAFGMLSLIERAGAGQSYPVTCTDFGQSFGHFNQLPKIITSCFSKRHFGALAPA